MDNTQRGPTSGHPSDVSAAAWSGMQGQDPVGSGTGVPAAEQERAVGDAQGTVGAGAPGFDPGLGETPTGGARTGTGPGPSAGGGVFGSPALETGADGEHAEGVDERTGDRGRDVAEQLKPVAVKVEDVTAKAVDLSAKGLTKLARFLEKRRAAREAKGRPDANA